MALHIQQPQPLQPQPESFGSALATGLAGGLQNLAALKLQQYQDRQGLDQRSQAYQGLGYAPQEAQALASLPENIQMQFMRDYGPQAGMPQQQQMAPQMQQQAAQQVPGMEQTMPEQQMAAPKGLPQLQPGIEGGRRLTKQQEKDIRKERLEERKVVAAEKKVAAQEKAEAFKQTKEERKKYLLEGRAAKDRVEELDRLIELEDQGLEGPGYNEFLKRSGLDIPALLNPQSEEAQKISQNFLRNASQIFGGKVSNYEAEQFLKMIPTLSNSPEGRKRIMANMKRLDQLAIAYSDAMAETMEANKGIPPLDLMHIVDRRVEEKRSKIADMFRKDLERPVPKGESKLKTAALATAGSAIGQAGRVAKTGAGAYAGYRLGSLVGPVGGAAGGVLGGLAGLTGLY